MPLTKITNLTNYQRRKQTVVAERPTLKLTLIHVQIKLRLLINSVVRDKTYIAWCLAANSLA